MMFRASSSFHWSKSRISLIRSASLTSKTSQAPCSKTHNERLTIKPKPSLITSHNNSHMLLSMPTANITAPLLFVNSRSFSTSSYRRSKSSGSDAAIPTSANPPTETAAVPPAESSIKITEGIEKDEMVVSLIPDKPLVMGETLDSMAEPSFQMLGLASWWPPGRMQYFMEWIHVSMDMPWWTTIVITTFCVRMVTFPLVIIAQRNVGAMNNHMPQIQALQEKLTDARRRGDVYESQILGSEMQNYMKKHGVNPLKNMVPILAQMPIFMSMFFGLRGMTGLPVDSMSTGGVGWFIDLTMKDPYYGLPIAMVSTLYLQFHFAADGAGFSQVGPIAKGVMKVLPLCLFPITMNFPAAITLYWATTNVFSVIQARLVRLPALRRALGIPELIDWNKRGHKKAEKGFRESVRETIDNWRVQADIADRRAHDEQKFRDAGMGKPPRTFKFDPTKPIVRKKL